MGKQKRAILSLLSFTLVAGAGCSRGPATPEEAIKAYVTAAKNGDVDTVLGLLAEGPRKSLAIVVDLTRAEEALDEALQAKFGKADGGRGEAFSKFIAWRKGRKFQDVPLMGVKEIEILDKKQQGGKVLLKCKVTSTKIVPARSLDASADPGDETGEHMYLVLKEKNAWNVLPGHRLLPGDKDVWQEPDPTVWERALQEMEDDRAVTKALVKEVDAVKSGKYKTRADAEAGADASRLEAQRGVHHRHD
jgi:hypothetical protein